MHTKYIEYSASGYKRIASIPAQIVVDLLRAGEEKIVLDDGLEVHLTSNRIKTYIKGVKCVHCGLEGKYFAVERQKNDRKYHLNIYAIKGNKEMMITSDHIKAKSRDGSNDVENRQPMCKKCNETKGSYDSVEAGIAALRAAHEAKRAAAFEKYKTMNDVEISLAKRLGNFNHCMKMLALGDTSNDWQKVLAQANHSIDTFLYKHFGVQSLT